MWVLDSFSDGGGVAIAVDLGGGNRWRCVRWFFGMFHVNGSVLIE